MYLTLTPVRDCIFPTPSPPRPRAGRGPRRCGDIGPKIGFNVMDNGFLALDRVRIPRANMAMRHQRVDRNGKYAAMGSSKEGSKIAYISMMQARRKEASNICERTSQHGLVALGAHG